jgi:FAD/FMN-containing dehydrogenase
VTTSLSPISLDQLRGGLAGRVVSPSDADYDALRTVMSGAVDARPAAIVRVANAEDVSRIVRYARATGTELAVRCGGHSTAGHGTTDGGIVIDLRDLTRIEIHPDDRTAWADGGLTAAEVATATAEHGLAIGFGDTGSVGIGGITLGGGIGYLVRRHGLTIDSLIAAEIVTADGQIRLIDEQHDPDLFWAIRGGGGNFGVVTRFRYRLHPLTRVIGGMLIQPVTPEALAEFMARAEAAPDELSVIANVMGCPPMPFVPEEHHGRTVLFSLVCWSGEPEEGERVLRGLREVAEPIADLVKSSPYPEMFPPEEGDYHPTAVGRTFFMDRVGVDEARAILGAIEASDAPMRAVQLRPLGGALARVEPDATAFAHRSSRIMAIVVSFYEGAEDRARREAWVLGLADALDQGVDGAYVNFLDD